MGTSFFDLKRGLKRLGVDCKISQAVKQKDVFEEITYPFITQIYNETGIHYITVFEKKRNKLIVGDSSKNRQLSISISKFLKKWIPYVLEMDFKRSNIVYQIEQKAKEISIWKIMNSLKLQLFLSLCLSIIVYVASVIIANIYTLYFNILIPQNLGELALQLMFIYILINFFSFSLTFINNFIYNSMSKKIDEKIIGKYFNGLLNKPNMAIESYEIGELLTNLSNVILIRQRFLTYLQLLPISVLTITGSFYLLYLSDEKLSFFVILLVIVLSLIIYLSDSHYEKLSKELIETGQDFNDSVIDTFTNVSIIKQLGLEKEFGNRGKKKLTNYIISRTKMLNFDSILNQIKSFVLSSFNIILFSTGVYLITLNQLSSGVLLTFNALLAYVTNPILNLANLQSVLVQGKVAQEKLYNILESQIVLYGNKSLVIENDDIFINFDLVSYDYDSNSKILKDISINICGNNIALSGTNGVGKSTTTKETVRCNVIQKQEIGTFTERITKEIPVENGLLQWQKANCALLIVMERYGKNGNISFSLMDQPLSEKGAIATTWAHDHHNLMVMGNTIEDILLAQNELLAMQGGYLVASDQQVMATCPLPIGGILSQAPIEQLGASLQKVRQAMQALGYQNMNEIMSFSTLSLPVSPAIKVTDFGMMDTKSQRFYPLVFPEDGVLLHENTH